jgi:hypothetical protein
MGECFAHPVCFEFWGLMVSVFGRTFRLPLFAGSVAGSVAWRRRGTRLYVMYAHPYCWSLVIEVVLSWSSDPAHLQSPG